MQIFSLWLRPTAHCSILPRASKCGHSKRSSFQVTLCLHAARCTLYNKSSTTWICYVSVRAFIRCNSRCPLTGLVLKEEIRSNHMVTHYSAAHTVCFSTFSFVLSTERCKRLDRFFLMQHWGLSTSLLQWTKLWLEEPERATWLWRVRFCQHWTGSCSLSPIPTLCFILRQRIQVRVAPDTYTKIFMSSFSKKWVQLHNIMLNFCWTKLYFVVFLKMKDEIRDIRWLCYSFLFNVVEPLLCYSARKNFHESQVYRGIFWAHVPLQNTDMEQYCRIVAISSHMLFLRRSPCASPAPPQPECGINCDRKWVDVENIVVQFYKCCCAVNLRNSLFSPPKL